MLTFLLFVQRLMKKYTSDEITVYAAQASFFIIMAAFPFTMLMLSIIQVIPSVSQNDLLQLFGPIIPRQFSQILFSLINSLYTESPAALLSLSALGRFVVCVKRDAWNCKRVKPDSGRPFPPRLYYNQNHLLWIYHCFYSGSDPLPGASGIRRYAQSFYFKKTSISGVHYPVYHKCPDSAIPGDFNLLLYRPLYLCSQQGLKLAGTDSRRAVFNGLLDWHFPGIFHLLPFL